MAGGVPGQEFEVGLLDADAGTTGAVGISGDAVTALPVDPGGVITELGATRKAPGFLFLLAALAVAAVVFIPPNVEALRERLRLRRRREPAEVEV